MNKIGLISIFSSFLLLAACEQNSDSNDTTNDNETVVQSLAEQQTEASSNEALASSNYPKTIPTGRLPESISPTEYAIHLKVDPDQPTFTGKVVINLKLEEATSHIWLHGKDITARSVTLTPKGGTGITGTYEEVDPTGVAKLTFDQAITATSAKLVIEYEAPFNEALEGLYRVKDGELNYAFTQFQATAARLAFPGFDEPAFKVPFNFSLTVRNEHSAFTSTPAVSETDLSNGWKKIVYAKSKPLPTYLVAFAVGEFDVVEWQDIPATEIRSEPVPLRGIATKGNINSLMR